MDSKIFQINKKPHIQGEPGLPKVSTKTAIVTKLGLEGDFNNFRSNKKGNDPDMAIMILSYDIIKNLNEEGWPVKPGDLGENIMVKGIEYSDFSPKKKYKIDKVEIKISFACDPCMTLQNLPYIGEKNINTFIKILMNRRGWYARVLKPGKIQKGDAVTIIS
tara:strand:- start:364 stop:849 length:486 start_codon:yes stop_codon:yes gene_type:complete